MTRQVICSMHKGCLHVLYKITNICMYTYIIELKPQHNKSYVQQFVNN